MKQAKPVLIAVSSVITAASVVGSSAKIRSLPQAANATKTDIQNLCRHLPSEGHLILSLQAISQRLGRTPTTTDINELSKSERSYPLDNYYDVFGSFTEAIKKAGLKANYKQKFDEEKLLGELRELHAKLKRPMLGKDVLAARKKGKVSSIYHVRASFRD